MLYSSQKALFDNTEQQLGETPGDDESFEDEDEEMEDEDMDNSFGTDNSMKQGQKSFASSKQSMKMSQ